MPPPVPLPGVSQSESMRLRQAAHLLIQVNKGFSRMAIIRWSMALMQYGRGWLPGAYRDFSVGVGVRSDAPFFCVPGSLRRQCNLICVKLTLRGLE
jgi:hypothetical protein